jgi:hypothetical protein
MADQNVKDQNKEEQKKKDSAKPLDSKDLDQVSGGAVDSFITKNTNTAHGNP